MSVARAVTIQADAREDIDRIAESIERRVSGAAGERWLLQNTLRVECASLTRPSSGRSRMNPA